MDSATTYGFTPLFIACEKADTETVHLLLHEGHANPDIVKRQGTIFSPLLAVVETGDMKPVGDLVASGARLVGTEVVSMHPLIKASMARIFAKKYAARIEKVRCSNQKELDGIVCV